MRKVIDDGPDGELALHMKGWLEFARWQQESVHASKAKLFDIDKQPRAAFAACDARIALQLPIRRIAAHDLDRIGAIDGFRRIGAPMHGLTIVAVAEELHDRFGADLDLGRPAAAFNLGHAFGSISAATARSRAGRSSKTVCQTCSSATSS
jgi:hypothetical protein